MRCPECKGSISVINFVKEKHCPACGAKLKRRPTKEQIKETLISFAEDKGYFFWAIVYLMVISVLAFFQQIFGSGSLFEYISEHRFRFLFLAWFAGNILDYIVKANVEVTSVRNKYIFKPPIYLRRFRGWTNFAVILGIALCTYAYLRWPSYLSPLTIYTFGISFVVSLFWALLGLAAVESDMDDKRIRYYFEELRVSRVKYLHRASAIYIGVFFLASILFYRLVKISGLWWYIYNSRFVYNIVTFFRNYFAWVHDFVD